MYSTSLGSLLGRVRRSSPRRSLTTPSISKYSLKSIQAIDPPSGSPTEQLLRLGEGAVSHRALRWRIGFERPLLHEPRQPLMLPPWFSIRPFVPLPSSRHTTVVRGSREQSVEGGVKNHFTIGLAGKPNENARVIVRQAQ